MKKFIVIFILLAVVSAMFLGCKKTTSNNNDNNTTSIDPGDYSFYMGIMKLPDVKTGYSIIFQGENDTISSVELKINNDPVEVTHEAYEGYYDSWFVSDFSFNENQTYTFEVKINESKSVSNFSLKIPDIITGDWPDNLDLTQATTISWAEAHDPMVQEFDGTANKTMPEDEVDKYADLTTSARSYTMPANWLPSDYDDYELSVAAGNYHTDSNLLAVAISSDYMDYGYTNKTSNIERMKNLMKRFAKLIK